ncbi:MAG: hypothetical protein ABI835_14045 [Chloroflexota bacterium]
MHRLYTPVLFVLLWMMPSCSQRNPDIALTLAPSETLTVSHEGEVRAMIETYYLGIGSLETQRDRSRIAQFATGPLLEALSEFDSYEADETLEVTRSISLDKVQVLEYTPTRVKAVGCGEFIQDEVTYEGEYVESSNPITLMNIFVFVHEDEVWKLFTMINFADTKGAIRDWAYVSEEEKEAIGDLQNIIDLYFGCGIV